MVIRAFAREEPRGQNEIYADNSNKLSQTQTGLTEVFVQTHYCHDCRMVLACSL